MKNFLKDLWDFVSLVLGIVCILLLGGTIGFMALMFLSYFGCSNTVAICTGCAIGGIIAVQIFKLASENIKEKLEGFGRVATVVTLVPIFGACVLSVSGFAMGIFLVMFTPLAMDTIWSIVVPAAWTISAVSTFELGIQAFLTTWCDK